jgi:hypothetical protein
MLGLKIIPNRPCGKSLGGHPFQIIRWHMFDQRALIFTIRHRHSDDIEQVCWCLVYSPIFDLRLLLHLLLQIHDFFFLRCNLIKFYFQIVDDKYLTFWCVFTHVITNKSSILVFSPRMTGSSFIFSPDKIFKFIGRYLSQSFESCDLCFPLSFWIASCFSCSL